jgi:putative addiction module component (TIGR02574 family)
MNSSPIAGRSRSPEIDRAATRARSRRPTGEGLGSAPVWSRTERPAPEEAEAHARHRRTCYTLAVDSKRVIDEALRLPPDARAALADELLASLEGETVDADREAAWADEIRRRLDAWQRGEVTAIPADDFLARLSETVGGKPTA